MPPSRPAGLLAFLLALPSLGAAVPPASDAMAAPAPEAGPAGPVSGPAVAAAVPPDGGEGPSAPGEAMEARLRRLSEAIRARAGAVEESLRGTLEGEPWLAAGGWWNGNNRGWLNRGWGNGGFNRNPNYYRTPQMWANFRPGWRNFSNGPRFINW